MHDIMEIITNERKHGVIMGDMNIDLLKFQTHNKTHDYLDSIFSHGFLPVITLPTRISCGAATLIDHIYTNKASSATDSGIIVTDVADHFGVFHTTKETKHTSSNTSKKTRIFSENNIDKFKAVLNQTYFDHILQITCPNKAYDEFIKLYLTAFEHCFPLRTIKANKKYIKKEPWMSPGLLTSARTKTRLFNRKLNKPTEQNINQYKTYNNIYNKLRRSMKKQHYATIIEENKFNIKKSWDILKQAIGKRNDKRMLPHEFKINNTTISDKQSVANSFNEYFSKIGHETSNNVPSSQHSYSDFMPAPLPQTMFFDPIDIHCITETTNKLKCKTSSGHDEISTKLLKQTIQQISIPMTHIINQSLHTGIVPIKMKIAKVVPIHKSSDPMLLKNYRPISLLTAFSKLLEKIVYNKTMNFLSSNNIFYKHQYGFRPKHSTSHPIIHLLNQCAKSNNKKNKELTLAVFCDLSKAFDVIDHNILLHKLNSYGIRGITNKWFLNYLSDRIQYVEIDGHRSNPRQLYCGVPQGSILGPLLYLIYVNDISKSCDSEILSFADDTTLHVSNCNVNTLYKRANLELNKLYNWFCANKLALNAGKTKYIVIRHPQTKVNLNGYNLLINGTALNRVGANCTEKSIKFLGVYIDEFLTWKHHIGQINSKVARALFYNKPTKTSSTW